jgi:hypothetical protein
VPDDGSYQPHMGVSIDPVYYVNLQPSFIALAELDTLSCYFTGCDKQTLNKNSKIIRVSPSYRHLEQPSLMDSYDYVMHGRIFSIKHIENQCVEVQASFGGLLCRLRGEQSQLESLQGDMM